MLSLKSKYRTHTCGELTKKNVGETVTLSGWVHRKRDHGGLMFIDLRDNYGITQCVFDGKNKALESVHPESVVKVTGKVVARGKDMVNNKISTGEIEIKADTFEVLTNAKALPFQVDDDDKSTPEDLRLKYRYLDLRRETMHKNILTRNEIIKFIRDKMWEMGFSEFQTPILTATSPEGARDFIVPSRMHSGMFYALPQAPQQFKQILQIAGFDRYFQIAPVFRDEDLRSDRVLEFYQLDVEMSFVDLPQIQEVGNVVMPAVVKKFNKNAKIGEIPHISYAEAMLKYGTDKPDLRNPIIISDVTDIFRDSDFGIFVSAIKNGAVIRAIPAPKTANKPRSWFDKLEQFAIKELGLNGLAYMVFGDEVKGPVAKKLDKNRVEKLRKISGNNSSLFFICDKPNNAAKAAGILRTKLGEDLGLIDPDEFRFCWIEEFPFFEEDDESPTGLTFTHNPFSLPLATLNELKTTKDPLSIKAAQMDMVLNGVELGSGGLRNFNPEVMLQVFSMMGYSKKDVQEKFSGLYTAFQYGVPPHGGFAFGIERLIHLTLGTPNLREVVAFTTNQRGQDLMMGAPSEVTEKQLREVHIKLRKKD